MINNKIYFESEIDNNNNVTKVNFVNDINTQQIITPNNILINNYKNFLNSKGIFIIKINIDKLEDYINKHLIIQIKNIIESIKIKHKGSVRDDLYNSEIEQINKLNELIETIPYDKNKIYEIFKMNKNNLINYGIQIIRIGSIFGLYTIMKENSIQTSSPTSIKIIIPKILFENDINFLNFLFDTLIPFIIPQIKLLPYRNEIYKKIIKNIFNGFNTAKNKEIKITNTINIILNIIIKIFIFNALSSNNYNFDTKNELVAELTNEFASIIPDTQCYFNQDNYLEFNPGICTSTNYSVKTCPVKTCPVKTCLAKTCPSITCPAKTCPVKTCPAKTCPEKTCPVKTCPEKKCPVKICPEKTCPVKTCPEKTCPVKTCPVVDLIKIPSKISSFTAIPNDSFIKLYWNEPFNGGKDIKSYLIQKSTDLSNWTDLLSTKTSLKVRDLSNGITYYFRVQAINIVGIGPTSEIINAKPVKINIMLYVGIIGGIIVLLIIIAIVIFIIRRNKLKKSLDTGDTGDTGDSFDTGDTGDSFDN